MNIDNRRPTNDRPSDRRPTSGPIHTLEDFKWP